MGDWATECTGMSMCRGHQRLIEALVGKKVVGAAAGERHTALWTEEWALFTFGGNGSDGSCHSWATEGRDCSGITNRMCSCRGWSRRWWERKWSVYQHVTLIQRPLRGSCSPLGVEPIPMGWWATSCSRATEGKMMCLCRSWSILQRSPLISMSVADFCNSADRGRGVWVFHLAIR